MPAIIACPSCGGKLRLSEELRGHRVRCPSCGHDFDSAPLADPPAPAAGPDPRDLPLELSLDSPSSEPRPPAANGPRGLVGAVELGSSPTENSSPPPPAPEPSPPPPPEEEGDENEWKECPECGKNLHPDSRRCYHCGHRFGRRRREGDEGPDIRHRGPRRDAEPDRGTMVLVLGVLSLASLSFCPPVGLILGLLSWIMGQRDLRKMKRGEMDSNGEGSTKAGWICGIIGVILNGLPMLVCMGMIGSMWYQESHRPLPAPPIRPAPIPKGPPRFPPPQPKGHFGVGRVSS